MNPSTCRASIEDESLVRYWLDELDAARTTQMDEHLLACAACAARLQEIADIADGLRALVRSGRVHGVVSRRFVEKLAEAGLRLREYVVAHNGSVHCTVTPNDDLLVSRLRVPLAGVSRMDMIVTDDAGAEQKRLHDIQFDPAGDEVIFLPATAHIRTLPATTSRIKLLAMDREDPVQIGEYTFFHTPASSA